ARVGYSGDAGYLLNPTYSQLAKSDLDMAVAGTRDAGLMVEPEAKGLPEDLMLAALQFGHQGMPAALAVTHELVREVGKPRWDWQAPAENLELASALKAQFGPRLDAAYQLTNKQERVAAIDAVRGEAIAALVNEASGVTADAVKGAFKKLEKK